VRPSSASTTELYRKAAVLLERWWHAEGSAPALRLLGVSLSDLQGAAQPDLFAEPARSGKLDQLTDAIGRRFGTKAIAHARALAPAAPKQEAADPEQQ
jgi:hypothetical protein